MDYALLSTGLVLVAVGDFQLTRHGHQSWVHLDEREKVIFGEDPHQPLGVELVLGLQYWLPMIGILLSVVLYRSTVGAMIDLGVPDLALALLYTGAIGFLFWAPAAALGYAAAVYGRRYVSGQPSTEARRRRAERIWRRVVAAGFVMTGIGFVSLLHLPGLAGIPAGLVLLKKRLDRRAKHLERCRQARSVSGGCAAGPAIRPSVR